MDKATLQAVKELIFEMRKDARKETQKEQSDLMYQYHNGQYHALSDVYHTLDYLERGESDKGDK